MRVLVISVASKSTIWIQTSYIRDQTGMDGLKYEFYIRRRCLCGIDIDSFQFLRLVNSVDVTALRTLR